MPLRLKLWSEHTHTQARVHTHTHTHYFMFRTSNKNITKNSNMVCCSGGSKGAPRCAPSPRPFSIFSISCSYSKKLAKSYVGTPLKGGQPLLRGMLDPPLFPEGQKDIYIQVTENITPLPFGSKFFRQKNCKIIG